MACPIFRFSECGQAFLIYLRHKICPVDDIPFIFYSLTAMKKILFIIGSLRKQSFNRQIACYTASLLKDQAQVEWLDFYDLPYINEDIEFPTPASVARVRKQVKEADGLWIFTPEYNYSYPAQIKNLLDWLSRPQEANDPDRHTAIESKPVAITGIGGRNQTKDCREKLTSLLHILRAHILPTQTGLTVNAEAWSDNTVIPTEEQMHELQQQANDFLSFLD